MIQKQINVVTYKKTMELNLNNCETVIKSHGGLNLGNSNEGQYTIIFVIIWNLIFYCYLIL